MIYFSLQIEVQKAFIQKWPLAYRKFLPVYNADNTIKYATFDFRENQQHRQCNSKFMIGVNFIL